MTANKREVTLGQSERAEAILRRFDFRAVHRAMVMLDWRWGIGDDARVPTVSDLQATARRMVERLLADDRCEPLEIECGGFRAALNAGVIRLSFEITDVDEEYCRGQP